MMVKGNMDRFDSSWPSEVRMGPLRCISITVAPPNECPTRQGKSVSSLPFHEARRFGSSSRLYRTSSFLCAALRCRLPSLLPRPLVLFLATSSPSPFAILVKT